MSKMKILATLANAGTIILALSILGSKYVGPSPSVEVGAGLRPPVKIDLSEGTFIDSRVAPARKKPPVKMDPSEGTIVEMTRAEYAAKFGTPAPATSVPVKMTREEYAAKYGPLPEQPRLLGKKPPVIVDPSKVRYVDTLPDQPFGDPAEAPKPEPVGSWLNALAGQTKGKKTFTTEELLAMPEEVPVSVMTPWKEVSMAYALMLMPILNIPAIWIGAGRVKRKPSRQLKGLLMYKKALASLGIVGIVFAFGLLAMNMDTGDNSRLITSFLWICMGLLPLLFCAIWFWMHSAPWLTLYFRRKAAEEQKKLDAIEKGDKP